MSIPHLFRCPISLDLFNDPVTLCTGQTYDRASIAKWLADGNLTCPVTMQKLNDTSLVPNHTLRHLIDQWLLSIPNYDSTQKATASGTSYSLSGMKQKLESQDIAISIKIEILKKVRILFTESDVGQASLIQLGYFPLLLQMVFQCTNLVLVEIALDCVLNLSPWMHLECLEMIRKEGNFTAFMVLLEQGDTKIKTSLCHLIETVSVLNATQDLCMILGKSRRVVHSLVSLLHNQNEAALGALSKICTLESNLNNVIREGAIDGLVAYLMNKNSSHKNCSIALATLYKLVGNEDGKNALMMNCNAIRILVKSVFRVSSKDDEESENAIKVLLVLCCESKKARTEAVNAGVLKQVLLLMQSQCGCKAKAKARALLALLKSMWIRDPSVGGEFYYVM